MASVYDDPSNRAERDKLLFTPGPLTTSDGVKRAMRRDLGSRDYEFIEIVRSVRNRLLALAEVSQADGYEAILMQGSGTFGIEATISSLLPSDGKLLVLANGAYGKRMAQIAERLKIETVVFSRPESEIIVADDAARSLHGDPDITHVAVVHCETTTGILNPIEEIGEAVRNEDRSFLVDAMSSFGAYPIPMKEIGIDALVSSANKCIEGVPGFSFVLANRSSLLASEGCARSVSLDLIEQWSGLEKNGQFRFTPPTHAILAFDQALKELEAEGGVPGRAKRYCANYERLVAGMRELGFTEYLKPELQGYIITSFRYPKDSRFDFEAFYEKLNERGFVIYPGKLSKENCFRIGNIGRIDETDIAALLEAVASTKREMGFSD